jgi:short-subunit dehydrogenase
MKIVILGATKGMGRALSRELVKNGHEVFLLGRDTASVADSARDLEIRSGLPRKVGFAACDLMQPSGFESALDLADGALGGFDAAVVSAGAFGTQDELESDATRLAELLTANFTNTILFCEAVRKRLLKRGGGTLCVFSSVAGDRARKPVVLYGASKAGLSYYLEGLDHKYRAAGLKTVCVKPGFVKTGMTAGLKPPPFAGSPEPVARQVARALAKGTPVVYTPAIWALILLIIRWLPRFVMRRIGF